MTTIKYRTKERALAAVTQNGYELEFCSPNLQNDEDVTMAAVKKNEEAFRYASSLRSNKAFVIKALNDGVNPWGLIEYANGTLQLDIEIMNLALEKSPSGGLFCYAQGEASLNKELAAKALVKWGNRWGPNDFDLWKDIHPTLKEFFPRDSFHEKAQAYLYQLEQEKQAKMVSGGSTEEDEVVW